MEHRHVCIRSFVSILLIFVLTFIAVLTLQAATIEWRLSHQELVYLYRTAQQFRCIADDGVAVCSKGAENNAVLRKMQRGNAIEIVDRGK